MANIKSAKKRILVAATRADRNKAIKSKACSKGVYHKNNAARKVSRLATLVNSMN